MARQKGTANFSGTLEVLAGGPIDARSVVPTLADLTVASNFPYAYVGLETYVVSENKKYRLIGADVTQSSNWEEVGSGGGGGGEEGGKMLTGTLTAAGWSNNTQTVTVTGVKSDTIGTVGILSNATAAQVTAAKSAGIVATGLGTNSVSFKCDNVPAIDIPFGVLIPGGGSGGDIDVDDALSSSSENPVQNKVIKAALDSKVNAVNGKGLSTNDYTTAEKNKLAGLSNYDDKALRGLITSKQDKLTAGNGIDITNNVISAGIPIVANQFDKANIYSTTEKVVGCWTDGRPIYQKTFEVTPGSVTTYDIATITNLKKLISATGWAENTSDHVYRWDIPNTNSADTRNTEYLFAIDNVLKINKPSAGATYHVTAQYTKTTDAANSFKYADENDYSTTEHIVGSWIDGKPIYQKTVHFGTLPNNTIKSVAHSISNFNMLIGHEVIAKLASVNMNIEVPFVGWVSATAEQNRIGVKINGTDIIIQTNYDYSTFDCYVTIKYTKTTD